MNQQFTIPQEQIEALTAKYGRAVPRYTSYPTAPEWNDEYSKFEFETAIVRSNQAGKDYSLYLHIPFCESQCYYCACNVIISPEHGIEEKYLDYLKRELDYLASQIDHSRRVIQMAWGGGTPTFLKPAQIEDLYSFIAERFNLYPRKSDEHEYSIEIDPRVTTAEHLKVLHGVGFNRLSMGIQDFNPKTQETINRLQSFESVRDLVQLARDIGFESINFDLIYGLPFQDLDNFATSLEQVKEIDPDRIALFNYAHIPQLFPFQNKYIKDEHLPSTAVKTQIFEHAVNDLCDFGYEFVGIDHFAKSDDKLAIAQRESTIYRNFQGYTTHDGCDLFSAGVTAISDVAGVFKQNVKKINRYYEELNECADKFKVCDARDIERRELIKLLMCQYRAEIETARFTKELELLESFKTDKLIEISTNIDTTEIKVTELGRYVIRNIASVFDTYLHSEAGHKLFSQSL